MATSETYLLNGPTTFAFPHNVRTPDALTVSVIPGGTVPPSAYEVIGYGPNSTGVTIRYDAAPTDGTKNLVVSRFIPASKVTDFTSDQAVTAVGLNDEFSNIYNAIADGSLSLGFDAPVVWTPLTPYIGLQSTVIYDNDLYYALATHTSSATFPPDADKWGFIADLTSLIQGELLQELVVSLPYAIPALDPVFSFIAVHSIDVDNLFLMWQGNALAPAASDTVLTMLQNGTPFGTITFPAATATPVFASTGDPPPRHLFNPGDVFAIIGPNTSDPSLAGVTLTLPFRLVALP